MPGEGDREERFMFRLYVAGARPQSSRAISNLRRICESHLRDRYDLEVIDIYQEPLRVLRAWWRQRRRPGYRAARSAWSRDLRRDPTANRGRRFGQALVLADELPAGTARLHAHFLHTPASVARYAALIRGLGWSCSAHAKDIWTTPDWEKREKLAALD